MSAPMEIGRMRYPPIPNVLSTINGIPLSCAIWRTVSPNVIDIHLSGYVDPTLASSGIGATLYFGLPILSTKIAFVLSSMALEKSSGSSPSTNLTPILYFLKVTVGKAFSDSLDGLDSI